MSPTVTGFVVIALGIWCQFGDFRRTVVVMLVLTVFEAANAADLVALGGASITPAKLFLLFLALRLVSMHGGMASLVSELAPRRVMFLYLLLVVWVVASGFLMPRLFANGFDVYSLERATMEDGPTPLKPSSGNITQSVYSLGGFFLAIAFCVLGRKPGAYGSVLNGLLLVTGLDIFFAIFDVVTWATHTEFLLDLVHTGNYVFLTTDVSGGIKRISGTFSEASAFAAYSLQLLAVNLVLFLAKVRPRLTGFYSAALAFLLFASTSSTAYIGLAVVIAAFAVYAVIALVKDGRVRPLRILGVTAAFGVLAVALAVLFAPGFAAATWNVLDVSLFQKAQSDSALERGELNAQAGQIFLDTWGLGAGIGSTRASNFVLVVASNLGVIGLALFAALMLTLAVMRLRRDIDPAGRSIIRAARAGLLTALVPATLISTVFDLGTLFYVLLGIVASGSAPVVRPILSAAQVRPRAFDKGWEVGQRPARSR